MNKLCSFFKIFNFFYSESEQKNGYKKLIRIDIKKLITLRTMGIL